MRTSWFILGCAVALAAGCSDDPDHPTTREALEEYEPQTVVGVVDGRAVGAAEVRLVADRVGSDPVDVAAELERRELLVTAALADGADVSFERKRAMVRAFLKEEIEGRVGPDDVPEEKLEQYLPTVRVELSEPSGFQVAAVRVAAMPLLKRDADLPAERAAELGEMAANKATEIRAWLMEEPTVERLESFDLESVEPPLRVEITPQLEIADPGTPKQVLPKGWVRSDALAQSIATMSEGEVSAILQAGPVYMFAMPRRRVEGKQAEDSEVQAEATRRALTDLRAQKLESLLTELREKTATATYPETLRQEAQLTE